MAITICRLQSSEYVLAKSIIFRSSRQVGKQLTIRKIGNKYRVESEKTGRNLGTYTSKKAAKKRLAQVEYFKHAKK